MVSARVERSSTQSVHLGSKETEEDLAALWNHALGFAQDWTRLRIWTGLLPFVAALDMMPLAMSTSLL